MEIFKVKLSFSSVESSRIYGNKFESNMHLASLKRSKSEAIDFQVEQGPARDQLTRLVPLVVALNMTCVRFDDE